MLLLTDHRGRRAYKVSELLMAGIAMFVFKEGSRNALNTDSDELFKKNYYKLFKQRLPHMDTVNAFLKELPCEELDGLKAAMVAVLIEKRVLHRFKLLGKYFTVAIDGTGLGSSVHDNDEQNRTHKTSKNGEIKYYDYMMEAKLVTSSGLAISMVSEPVFNEDVAGFKKQDCEIKAFVRLAANLKKYFPKLPMCLLADGLYPNQTFMQTCEDNDRAYVAVLQDDSLKTLQEDIIDVEEKRRHSTETSSFSAEGKTQTDRIYEWRSEALSHKTHTVYWLKCTEKVTVYDKKCEIIETKTNQFVYLTNQIVGAKDKQKVKNMANAGRQRWKIENEGFNTQKNRGYDLKHKYSRNSFTAMKNYYQCLQMAHMINQLVEHSCNVAALVTNKTKMTMKQMWKDLIAYLKMWEIEESVLEIKNSSQIRLVG